MLPKPPRRLVMIAGALLLLCDLGLIGCERPPKAGLTATQPRPADVEDAATDRTKEPFAAEAQAEPGDRSTAPADDAAADVAEQRASDAAPTTIDMDEPEEPEPPLPPYLSVVERIDPGQQARVYATPIAPNKLEVTTENVKRLRLTRERLPLSRHRSTVLRIDGQGIEWTPKYVAVELERSPAGAWTVVRRKPVNP